MFFLKKNFIATVIPFDLYTEITPEEASVFTSITTAISLIIALIVVSSIAAFTYYYKVMSKCFFFVHKLIILQY